MVAAEFASNLDIKVAAVERDRVGGDCLWTGCVPSKALLASAKAAHTMRHADKYGLTPVEPEIDTARVFERIRAIQQQLADTDDNADRFTEAGVDVHFGAARLTGPNSLEVEGVGELKARFILLCTGSRPAVPPLPGLEEAGFLTSETIWDLPRAPESLVVIGGGPISIEMSQAFARLGVRTTVLQKGDRILPRDEPDLVARLTERLRADGVDLVLDVDTESVSVEDGMKVVRAAGGARVAGARDPRGRGAQAQRRGPRPRGDRGGDRPPGRGGRRQAAHVGEVDLRGRRPGRAVPVHALGRLRGRGRDPQHVLPRLQRRHRLRAVVHLHRSRAGPRRADRRRGAPRSTAPTTCTCGPTTCPTPTAPAPTAPTRARSAWSRTRAAWWARMRSRRTRAR